MSHNCYNKLWTETQGNIKDMLFYEMPLELPKPEKDRKIAFQQLATMYVKYIKIYKNLELCYDQIVQPQKRQLLRQVLDATIGRILELKNEMVNLEFSEFHYFDDILADYKLTPHDIELPIPKYFLLERKRILKDREGLLDSILTKLGIKVLDKKDMIQLTFEEAVHIIQMNERARQGRLRAKFMKEIRLQEEREKRAEIRGVPAMSRLLAALLIQKVWKGFLQRKRTEIERNVELEFLGMTPPPLPNIPGNTAVASALNTMEKRRAIQEVHEEEYRQALVSVKERIQDVEGSDMKERMQDQIRQWFIECRDASGKFPDYPPAEDGGSALIFQEKDPLELELELKAKEEEEGEKKGKKKDEGKTKARKEPKKVGKKKEAEYEGWKMAPSNFITSLQEGNHKYKEIWAERQEEHNFMQKHDVELIKEEKRLEVETEIRIQVDELMREELKNLKLAVDREKSKKKGKSGKKKKGSGKKGKKKKEKDMTPDRTIESLYEELVTQQIIVPHPKVQLEEFIGDFCYLGTLLRHASIEPMPSLCDIRRVITLFGILPLGSQAVHEKAPLIKSILLAGPRGTGKKMLLHALCTETGANLFDLSATNLVGKYPGKDGLKMLMHLVGKVGRALQPSVIYIGDCERMAKRKIPKSDPTNPKRLAKEMPKFLKTVKPEDRLLLVGTSRCPYEGEMKPLSNLYQKIILIPRPDYTSRYSHGITLPAQFDLTSLAKVTDGFTPGDFVSALKSILTDHRKQSLNKRPLQAIELLTPLSAIDPVYKEQETVFKDWYAKTPLGKKRNKAAKQEMDTLLGKSDKKDSKGKKKKKKKK
ncbi:regulatory complex 11-like [Octopus vulgaris]|uniref:Regulatory complex 11-like n=1 Tax=Octopus vulgaris TaxID=6645 RepID=A0AA36AQ00_OCTVU|nr:regulatory complex 11-like [Octopus vulgaris]